MKAQPGITIDGKYRLLSPLGAGAMGAVWLAEQISVDRKVAIKLLHPTDTQTTGLDARFAVEAKAIARLNHPNCITLYDFGFSAELSAFYTVIEYVKGVVLGKKMGAPMGFNDAVAIIRQAAKGLDHAHFHNILHRDLKPDNLMLADQSDGSELLKILDFGIAKIVNGEFGVDSQDDEIRLTKAGEVFGTPAYMSPEQARSTRQLTPASDFYALGVIFYEMIDGRLPFFASTSFDVLMMHVTEEVPRIQRKDVPEKIADVIYKLLEKHPYDRFQSGKEIMAALGSESFSNAPLALSQGPTPTAQFLNSVDTTFPPQSAIRTQPPASSKKRYWMILVLLALVSVGSIAAFAMWDRSEDGIQPTTKVDSAQPLEGPIEKVSDEIVFDETEEDPKVVAPEEPEKIGSPKKPEIVRKKTKKKATATSPKKKAPKKFAPKEPAKKTVKKIQLIKSESTVKKLGLD